MIIDGCQVEIQLNLFVFRWNFQQLIRNALVNLLEILFKRKRISLEVWRRRSASSYQSCHPLEVSRLCEQKPRDLHSDWIDMPQQGTQPVWRWVDYTDPGGVLEMHTSWRAQTYSDVDNKNDCGELRKMKIQCLHCDVTRAVPDFKRNDCASANWRSKTLRDKGGY